MKAFEIEKVPVQGFCGGVKKALQTALDTRQSRPGTITILGSLVHNKHLNDDLEKRGIRIAEKKGATRLELLDEIPEGTVVFTAHGVSDQVRQKAHEKGLDCVDASCPFVLRTQQSVKEKITDGYEVFYIGKKGHPEAEAVYMNNPHVHLVTDEASIPSGITAPVFVTNQTTMSILDIRHLFDAIRNQYPDAVFHDEICHATRVRQEAVLALQDKDVLVVVGDKASNNTSQLAVMGHKAGIGLVFCIEDESQLDVQAIPEGSRIAVTSGASTPDELTDAVIEKLKAA